MSVELMLNAVNLNLVAFDVWLRDALHVRPGAHAVRHHDRRRRDRSRPGHRAARLPQPRERTRRSTSCASSPTATRTTTRGGRRRDGRLRHRPGAASSPRSSASSLGTSAGLARRCRSRWPVPPSHWSRALVLGAHGRSPTLQCTTSRRSPRSTPVAFRSSTSLCALDGSRRACVSVAVAVVALAVQVYSSAYLRATRATRRTPRSCRCSPPRCCSSSSPTTCSCCWSAGR